MRSREQHVEWCKDRALELVEHGQLAQALTSMISDLRKHSETEDHVAIELGVMLFAGGHLSTEETMREFIVGFR